MGLVIGGVDLEDSTKYLYHELDEQPNWDVRIKKGCSGGWPVVEMNAHIYDVLPIEVICLGSTIDTAMSNRNTLIAEVLKPLDKTNPPVYITRTVLSQSQPDIWTLMACIPTHIRREWDGLRKIWYRLDLYVFPGQRLPGGL